MGPVASTALPLSWHPAKIGGRMPRIQMAFVHFLPALS
jgi:hypothetical protein